jgi:pimeloyl-ACP methyl ester carboxylesterase
VAGSQQTQAVGRLVGDVLAGGVHLVWGVHEAVASRVFGYLGPPGRPAQAVHHAVAGGVYRLVGGAQAAMPRAAAGLVALTGAGTDTLADSPRGRLAVEAANGLWGDTIAGRYPPLAVPMTVRLSGRDLLTTPASLTDAYPAATGRIAVFVHGLGESEQWWWRTEQQADGTQHTSFGSRLRDDLGFTPVYLRYNTGLHISDNGQQLAALIEELAAGWPIPVEQIALIGHSMGGLVARSACHYGQRAEHRWAAQVRHVVCLGSPHLGAPLEQGVHVASWLLARLPETRPLAAVLNLRSVGVKDLRYGSCVEDDWCDADPEKFLRDRCTEVPFLPHAAYYFVAATLTEQPDHPIGRLIGDLFVQFASASGQGRRRRIPFEAGNGTHLGRLHHFDLLTHPAVYQALREWLSTTVPRTGPSKRSTGHLDRSTQTQAQPSFK